MAKGFGGAGPLFLLGEGSAEEVVEAGDAPVGGRGGLEEREDFGTAAFAIEEVAEGEEGIWFSDGGGVALAEFEGGAKDSFCGRAAEGVEGLATGCGDTPGSRGAVEGSEGVDEAVKGVEGAGPVVAGVGFFRVHAAG